MSFSPDTRVVITGMGMVTPLGVGVEASWRRLLAGESGVVRLADEFVNGIDGKVGALVPMLSSERPDGFDPSEFVSSKDQKKMDRFILFALAAAREALQQADWLSPTEEQRLSTATIVASGIGGFPAIADAVRTVDSRGPRRLSPFTVPSFLVNLAAGHISLRYGFTGPIGAPATACAASVQAIGDAVRMIRAGEVKVAVCGGAEACVDLVSLAAFGAARALSTRRNDEPARASRPFDLGRDGFVMGEGAGILVVESLEHALARGKAPIAEVLGYGASADAYHLTAGAPDGAGARHAMQTALRQARLEPGQIDYLNAHATSTPVGDAGEIAAIRAVFGDARAPAVSSTKGATGHLLGAAGGVEAIFSALSIRDQRAPATLNLETPDPAAEGLDLIRSGAREMPIDHVMSNGFGFGGVNSTIILGAYRD